MNELKFGFEGRNLSVRAYNDGSQWSVRIFEGDRQATSVVYTVTDETNADAKHFEASSNLVQELIELAKAEVLNGNVLLLPSE